MRSPIPERPEIELAATVGLKSESPAPPPPSPVMTNAPELPTIIDNVPSVIDESAEGDQQQQLLPIAETEEVLPIVVEVPSVPPADDITPEPATPAPETSAPTEIKETEISGAPVVELEAKTSAAGAEKAEQPSAEIEQSASIEPSNENVQATTQADNPASIESEKPVLEDATSAVQDDPDTTTIPDNQTLSTVMEEETEPSEN